MTDVSLKPFRLSRERGSTQHDYHAEQERNGRKLGILMEEDKKRGWKKKVTQKQLDRGYYSKPSCVATGCGRARMEKRGRKDIYTEQDLDKKLRMTDDQLDHWALSSC